MPERHGSTPIQRLVFEVLINSSMIDPATPSAAIVMRRAGLETKRSIESRIIAHIVLMEIILARNGIDLVSLKLLMALPKTL